jgi:beta-glucanase (GH16 family)
MVFRCHEMKQLKLVPFALVLLVAVACSVKEAGLPSTQAEGSGGASASGGAGGAITGGGSGGQATGGVGGDAALPPDDGGKVDSVGGTGGTGGTGGAGGVAGPDGGGGSRDSAMSELGPGDVVLATGGVSSTGGVQGAGGGGTGGTAVPDGAPDGSGDATDARRDLRDGASDRTPDRAIREDVALDTPTDKPFVESDGSYFAEVPANEAGPLVLAWSDEFDGETNTGVDVSKWSYVTWGPGAGAVNNEVQQYTSSTNNVFLDGSGHLVIRAQYNPVAATNPYTSGRIESRIAFGPGHRIEVRAKLPIGVGSFPAILLKGTTGEWPQSGALGLLEQYGQDKSWFYATAYAGDEPGSGKTAKTKYTFPDALTANADFHVYALDWHEDSLVFQVDGLTILTSTYGPSSPFATITEYLVLDVALGGDMGGTIDNAAFPMEMMVDYVRVYTF